MYCCHSASVSTRSRCLSPLAKVILIGRSSFPHSYACACKTQKLSGASRNLGSLRGSLSDSLHHPHFATARLALATLATCCLKYDSRPTQRISSAPPLQRSTDSCRSR